MLDLTSNYSLSMTTMSAFYPISYEFVESFYKAKPTEYSVS